MFKLLAKLKTSGNALKYTANIIFLSISCLLIANLLIQLSDERFIKTIFVIVAVGLDIFRQYVVALAKFYWRSNIVKSIALWFVYIIHVSVVLIASVGFSLSAIDTKVKNTEVYNLEKQAIIDNIKSNETEIKRLELVKATLNNYDRRFKELSSRIDSLQKTDRGLFENLKNFAEVKVNIQTDVYNTLGKALPIHINGEFLKLYMLLIISLLIELALLVTSWDIRINDDIKQESPQINTQPLQTICQVTKPSPLKDFIISNRDNLFSFIDALLEDGPNRLKGNDKIAIQTGLNISDCQRYRDLLQQLSIEGTSLIYASKGLCKANFNSETIKQVVLQLAA